MNLLDRIRADVNGARILADWLGDGGEIVGYMQEASRASDCIHCPQNKPGHKFEEETAKAILEQVTVASEAGIHIPLPDQPSALHTCAICNCYLPLKNLVPWKHLKNFTDPAKFPQNCWIPKEATALQGAQQNSTDESPPVLPPIRPAS